MARTPTTPDLFSYAETAQQKVKARTPASELVQRLPARRPCRVINEYGKEVVFRIYGEKEQDLRCSEAISHVGEGENRRTIIKRGVKCENCGRRIRTWDFFCWRLYGLCTTCHDRSKAVYLDACVLVFRTRWGRLISRWEKPGGRDDQTSIEKRAKNPG